MWTLFAVGHQHRSQPGPECTRFDLSAISFIWHLLLMLDTNTALRCLVCYTSVEHLKPYSVDASVVEPPDSLLCVFRVKVRSRHRRRRRLADVANVSARKMTRDQKKVVKAQSSRFGPSSAVVPHQVRLFAFFYI